MKFSHIWQLRLRNRKLKVGDIFIRMVLINHIIIQLYVIAVGTEVVQVVVAVIMVMSFIMLK